MTTPSGEAAAVAAGAETTDNRIVAPAPDIHAEMLAALKGARVVIGLLPVPDEVGDDVRRAIDRRCKAIIDAIARAEGRKP